MAVATVHTYNTCWTAVTDSPLMRSRSSVKVSEQIFGCKHVQLQKRHAKWQIVQPLGHESMFLIVQKADYYQVICKHKNIPVFIITVVCVQDKYKVGKRCSPEETPGGWMCTSWEPFMWTLYSLFVQKRKVVVVEPLQLRSKPRFDLTVTYPDKTEGGWKVGQT